MQEGLRLVAYADRYRGSVLELFHSVPYKAAIWEWEFESCLTGKAFDPVLIVDGDDQVVGFNGIIPVPATSHGKPLDLAWSCDFYVSADYRGKGIGSWLKRELDTRASIILAFGVSDQADRVLSHLGWSQPTEVNSYRMTRQWHSLRDLALRMLQWSNRVLGWFSPSVYRGTLTVQEHLPKSNEVNALWQSVEADYEAIVSRNYRFLDWRYQRHPFARYAFVTAHRASQLQGLMVVRYCQGGLKIVDYCGPAHNVALKRAFVKFCRRHWRHAEQFSLTTSDTELGQSATREGFFKARSLPRFFMRMAPGKEMQDCPERPHWFIMTGDSDGELLQAAADFSRGF